MRLWLAWPMFLYFLMVGGVLLIAPWTALWEVSVFADLGGLAGGIYNSVFFRTAVALLGAITLVESLEVYKKFIGRSQISGRSK